MRQGRKIRLITALGAGVFAAALAAAPATAAPTGKILPAAEPVAGSYIVVLKDLNATAASTTSTTARLVAQYGGTTTATYTSTIRGFAAKLDEASAKRLAGDPAVAYVQQDGVARIAGIQQNPTWGLDRIDQNNLPFDRSYTYPNTGSGATAYILDTGVDKRHPDLEGRVSDGRDFIDNDSDASDCQGHGTHVAGTVGSKTYGVAKQVKLVSVRVLNCQGSGQYSQIISGIDWVARNATKPAVANMSLGADTATDNAVRRAIQSGVTFAVASGNSNTDACSSTPARVPEAITVNATDRQDSRSSFSNYGRCTDIFAPGTDITSTLNGGGSGGMSGTSMATPHVAGAVALYLTANPSATPAQVRDALVNNGTQNAVRNPGSGSTNRLLHVGFISGAY
ncbi:S8 family peptidase [Saccharopolyspora shandongensis]|uniref:S8 family peptidase n=1 Tax=Saccharopolyspora shandongensis TaxID=418495 RepID=UPI0033D7BA3F